MSTTDFGLKVRTELLKTQHDKQATCGNARNFKCLLIGYFTWT
ncbi:hypothetical protein U535_02542 [Staphylococcus aureus F88369]|nr:hypothetical protein U648_02607 [Staphylococcus aureus M16586]EWL39056.1 hypothetical protein U535_02542 [Staphylococcus aureus F88369]EWL43437.1 hypothetical protein U533_02654 [Staphylococcus aureus F84732]